MSDFCFIPRLVDSSECIGDSLSAINISLSALDTGLCELSSYTNLLIQNNPVNEIIRGSVDLCFTNIRHVGSDDVHLFGGIGPSDTDTASNIFYDVSSWNSCYRKLPYITTELSGTHLRFPLLTASTDTDDDLRLAVFDSNNALHVTSAINLFKNNLVIKDENDSTIYTGPSAIKFDGEVTVTGGEVNVALSNLELMSALTTLYSSSTLTSGTTAIDVSTLSGYDPSYKHIYLYYDLVAYAPSAGKDVSLTMTVNGFPAGRARVAATPTGADATSDSGYVFIKIPSNKIINVVKTAIITGTYSKPSSLTTLLKLYGWSK